MKSTPPTSRQVTRRDETSDHPLRLAFSGLRLVPRALPRWVPLAAILLAGALLRGVLLVRDVPPLNSDEAVVGLMGLHAGKLPGSIAHQVGESSVLVPEQGGQGRGVARNRAQSCATMRRCAKGVLIGAVRFGMSA